MHIIIYNTKELRNNKKYSSLAQSVERSAVNRNVVSSSLTRGAKNP